APLQDRRAIVRFRFAELRWLLAETRPDQSLFQTRRTSTVQAGEREQKCSLRFACSPWQQSDRPHPCRQESQKRDIADRSLLMSPRTLLFYQQFVRTHPAAAVDMRQ